MFGGVEASRVLYWLMLGKTEEGPTVRDLLYLFWQLCEQAVKGQCDGRVLAEALKVSGNCKKISRWYFPGPVCLELDEVGDRQISRVVV